MPEGSYKVVIYGGEVAMAPDADKSGAMPHPTDVAKGIAEKLNAESADGWELVSLVPVAYRLERQERAADDTFQTVDYYRQGSAVEGVYQTVDYYAAYFRRRGS